MDTARRAGVGKTKKALWNRFIQDLQRQKRHGRKIGQQLSGSSGQLVIGGVVIPVGKWWLE